jgi:hypothetical protein
VVTREELIESLGPLTQKALEDTEDHEVRLASIIMAALMGGLEQDDSGEVLHSMALQAGLLCFTKEDEESV